MAYETAPRCCMEIERLTAVLRISYAHQPGAVNSGAISDVFNALEVLSSATRKFGLFENWRPEAENLSDLDILDFEHTTTGEKDKRLDFPREDFELAQKGSYMLLTQIMGLLELLSVMFPGRNYTTRTKKELEILWKNKRVGVRVVWVEKQIAGWETVEDAIRLCREWHKLRPGLQSQAMTALKEWQMTERMYSPSECEEYGAIQLSVVAATGLPKPNLRTPTARAKVSCYGVDKKGVFFRVTEYKTEVATKSQNPV